jgi:hypothetical protein
MNYHTFSDGSIAGSYQSSGPFYLDNADTAGSTGGQFGEVAQGGNIYAVVLSDLKDGHALAAAHSGAIYGYCNVIHVHQIYAFSTCVVKPIYNYMLKGKHFL